MRHIFLFAAAAAGTLISHGQANTRLSNLASPTAVNQHLLPNSTNTRDLGSSSYAWKSAYFRGYIYLDGTRFVSNAQGTGNYNAFLGSNAGLAVTSGYKNAGLGHYALYKTTTGYSNTAAGAYALYENTSGYGNTGIGVSALNKNTTGYYNTAVGDSALFSNSTGTYNTSSGLLSLYRNTTGSYNTSAGISALYSNTTGNYNSSYGTNALIQNESGSSNTGIGMYSLYYITQSYNTGLGYGAGDFSTGTISKSTFLGADTRGAANATNATAVGYGATTTASNQVRIGNASVTSIGGYQPWTNLSDGRFKKNVQANVPGLEFINLLKPVTYTLDIDGIEKATTPNRAARADGAQPPAPTAEELTAHQQNAKVLHTGFVAQDVEAAATKLNYDFSGIDKPKNSKDFYGLRYSEFVVPLVKAVQQLDADSKAKDEKIATLEKEMQALKLMLQDLKNGQPGTLTSAYLEQNSPNPASGTTTIRYFVPTTAGKAAITVTNMKGQLIKTMSLATKGSGQITLNSAALAAGTYNYSLWVDGKQADTKRTVIVR